MSQINQALETRSVEYLAFQSTEKIKLSVQIIRQFIAVPFYNKEKKEYEYPSDEQCVKFMLLNRARQLNPFEADSFMIPFWDSKSNGPQWSLITAHNAFLKRAEVHPQYEGMESGVLVEVEGEIKELHGDFVPDTLDGEKVKLVGGWAKVHRKDRKTPMYKRAKLSTWQKNFGHWLTDPAGQITKIAEADALRSSFPNTLGGMYLREEHTTEVQAEVSSERRPDFGQTGQQIGQIMDANRPASAQRKPKAITEAAKTPQEAPGQQPATPSQPPQETAAAPAEPPAQAPVEPPATVRNDPENPPAETTAETSTTTVSPEEDLSTPPETEPPQGEQQAEAPAAFVPDTRDTAPVQNVKRLCHEAGLTVEQLMTWARAKKIAKEGQKLNELAEQKLTNIGNQWQVILPIIRQTAAK